MKQLVALLLCTIATVPSLKVSRFVPDDVQYVPAKAARRPNATLTQPSILSTASKAWKLVWLLGCSVDWHAFTQACQNADVPVMHTEGVQYCTFSATTLVFTFHPGATPPPYYHYQDLNFDHTTTQDIVRSQSERINNIFLHLPDAIVVDSSLWDVANWWTRDGRPGRNWHASHADIDLWCDTTVPKFLKFVQDTVPHSRVAFRSIPPVFDTCWEGYLCNATETVDKMNSCLMKSKDAATHQLYGEHALIDWNEVIQSTEKVLPGPLRQLYNDNVHPGPQLSLAYMDAALKWARRQ
jgi:hypothetical protein